MRTLAAALLFALSLPAFAEETTSPANTDEARARVAVYLDAVKAKKWPAAKKAIHPKTLEAIDEIRRRTKIENHALAPWARVKESYLTRFEIKDARVTDHGAVVVSTVEDHFSIEDQGTEEGVQAEYLVVKIGDTWWVTDRRLGEGIFQDGVVAVSYKGYFEGEYEPPKGSAKGKGGKGR